MDDVLSPPQSEGVARTTGGADGYTPHNDLPSWEVGLYIAKVVDMQGVMHIFKLLCH